MSEAGILGVALRRNTADQVAASAKALRWEPGEANAASGGGQGERREGMSLYSTYSVLDSGPNEALMAPRYGV